MIKRAFILALFLAMYNFSFTQMEWFVDSAEWYYSRPGSVDYWDVKPRRMQIVEDTLIAGIKCKKLEFSEEGAVIGWEYAYESNDSVFYFNRDSQGFFLLYDFNAQAGDTVKVHESQYSHAGYYVTDGVSEKFDYKVNSIRDTMVEGRTIRIQNVSPVYYDCFYGFDGDIYEGMGHFKYFFGNPICMDAGGGIYDLFRCYIEKNGFRFQSPTWEYSCDTILPLSINERDDLTNIDIYPNPVKTTLRVDSDVSITSAKILSLQGKVIMSNSVGNKKDFQLELKGVSTGVYFLILENSDIRRALRFIID